MLLSIRENLTLFSRFLRTRSLSRSVVGLLSLAIVLLLLANAGEWGHLVGAPAPLRDGMKRMLDRSGDAMTRAREAGVTFVLGTDSGFCHGGS